MTELAGWENFYVIVGSSAGALIGLQFVVMTLMAETPGARDMERATDAFGTPTVVHFGVVLLLAAIISAPWKGVGSAAVVWGVLGVVGLIYEVIVAWRMRVQLAYSPQFEDWLFHGILPFLAYAVLTVCAYMARSHGENALFGIAAAALLLLFVGIHNAWDTITYHVFTRTRAQKSE